jgi:2-hydroxy-6-oxonona-2,4-dienedioate hydrolase
MRKRGYGLAGLCIAGGLAGAAIYLRYRNDLRAARERVATGGRIIETEHGPIEYGISGSGPPVLLIHGAGGGYDQGLLIGSLGMADEFQVIAPSRFGYLNSPIPEDCSLEAQADAYACLLDALEIDRVVVVAFSAGGPSGFHFARRYPERTDKLVAASAISYTDPSSAEEREREASINRVIGSDFFYWLAITAARSLLLELFGVSREVKAGLMPTEMARVDQLLEAMLPMSERLDGILLDQECDLPRDFPLGEITAPTLVIHARDDSLVDYSRGQHTAESIAGAELLTFIDGGHFLAGHYDEIKARIKAFLAESAE